MIYIRADHLTCSHCNTKVLLLHSVTSLVAVLMLNHNMFLVSSVTGSLTLHKLLRVVSLIQQ